VTNSIKTLNSKTAAGMDTRPCVLESSGSQQSYPAVGACNFTDEWLCLDQASSIERNA
jgi:hypothetical protein